MFCQWSKKRDHPKAIEVLAPNTLDSILKHRYLHESNYEYSILNSRFFKGSRDVLKGKARLLREKGLGKKTKKQIV